MVLPVAGGEIGRKGVTLQDNFLRWFSTSSVLDCVDSRMLACVRKSSEREEEGRKKDWCRPKRGGGCVVVIFTDVRRFSPVCSQRCKKIALLQPAPLPFNLHTHTPQMEA